MSRFVKTFLRNIATVFRGRNLWWHLLAIMLTYAAVASGFDWWYYQHTQTLFPFLIVAAPLGFLVPLLVPLAMFLFGSTRKDKRTLNTAYALVQSVAIAWLISSFYKAFTGRAHPDVFGGMPALTDITHVFHFGFLRGGIFWGWPSSHAMVACALAATLSILSRRMSVRMLALVYAVYVTIGVSATVHWFSDALAGAILGTLVGITVGTGFIRRRKFQS